MRQRLRFGSRISESTRLIPACILIVVNILLISFANIDRHPVTFSLISAAVGLPAVGLMLYATIRFGLFLEFDSGEWVAAVLLFLFCTPLLSILYVYVKAKSPRLEMKYVGRIYEDEEFDRAGGVRRKPEPEKRVGGIFDDE